MYEGRKLVPRLLVQQRQIVVGIRERGIQAQGLPVRRNGVIRLRGDFEILHLVVHVAVQPLAHRLLAHAGEVHQAGVEMDDLEAVLARRVTALREAADRLLLVLLQRPQTNLD